MKKQLLILSMLAVFMVIACIAYANPAHPPVRTIEIPFVQLEDMTIDGLNDEAGWSPEQSTDAFNTTGSTGADADFTFSFKVAFNPLYLYIIGTILDDFDNSIPYTTTPNAWEYDNVEIFISLDTTNSTSPTTDGYEDDSNCVQLRFCRGLDSIQTPGRATQEEYIYHWENTASGWLFEAAIPWTAVLAEGQTREDMCDYLDAINGFDVAGADSDEPGAGNRDCQTFWDMDDPSDPSDRTEDNAWTDRSVFGIMTLADASDFIWVGLTGGLEDNVRIYPNPAGNTVHFDLERPTTIKIYTLTGIQIMEVQTTGEIDISSLKRGIYLAESNSGFVKFIKKK